ncbi:MAG: SDR family NAD(P)-dependent oxidoreductase [Cellvibrionaceae bacterium]
MNTQKQTAIVTGSSKGIGRAIAKQLLLQGYQVVVTSRKKEDAENVAAVLSEETKATALGLAFDLEDPAGPKQLIEETINALGRLDVLVNNALSISINVDPLTCDEHLIDAGITANITNVVKLCRHAYPHLKESKGNIINISSSVTKRYVLGLPLYAMSKAAILKLTEAFAAEWAKDCVRVNAVNPGFTDSDAAAGLGLTEAQISKLHGHFDEFQLLGTAVPENIAPLITYLASKDASMVTGAIIDIDGGHHVQGHPLFPRDLFA